MHNPTPFTPTTNSGNPYIKNSPASPPLTAANALNTLGQKLDSAAKKVENFTGNVYTHFRTGPGFANVAMARFDHAARLIVEGSSEHIFRKEFGQIPGEKLIKAHACYLSITGGPILGTLYVSNIRVGFKSDGPVWTNPGRGPGCWEYYKVIVPVNQIETVNPVTKHNKSSGEKYIELITIDGHEFWFMGFIYYDTAIKNLYEALHKCKSENLAIRY